jgi:TonB family protein
MAYQETSFGSAAQVGARPSTGAAAVKTGGFGDASAGPVTQSARAKQIEEKPTPVEILAKPKPIYTEEARQLKVEGDVTLEVVFLASGGIQVVRVVHGLGHGLDEVAVRVAKDIHFRPSTVHGVAVDSKAIIHVTFELT